MLPSSMHHHNNVPVLCKKPARLYLYVLRSQRSADFSPALSLRLTAASPPADNSQGGGGREEKQSAEH